MIACIIHTIVENIKYIKCTITLVERRKKNSTAHITLHR